MRPTIANVFLLASLAVVTTDCSKDDSILPPDPGSGQPTGFLFAGGVFYYGGSAAMALTDTGWWDANNGLGKEAGIQAFAVYNGALYCGGFLPTTDYNIESFVARWNGSGWSKVYSTRYGAVYALAVYNGSLYLSELVASSPGAVGQGNIKRLDGSSWTTLPHPPTRYWVSSLAVFNNELYAGGSFTSDSVDVGPAHWNGSTWSTGGSFKGSASTLAVINGELFAGVSQLRPDGTAFNGVARYDGSSWTFMGSSLGPVNAIADLNGELYAGGITRFGNVARWNGADWTAVGSGLSSFKTQKVLALIHHKGKLYAGGSISSAEGRPAYGVACWDGSVWTGIGPSKGAYAQNNEVSALIVW